MPILDTLDILKWTHIRDLASNHGLANGLARLKQYIHKINLMIDKDACDFDNTHKQARKIADALEHHNTTRLDEMNKDDHPMNVNEEIDLA